MADDPVESAGCLFVILFVILLMAAGLYSAVSNPQYAQLVCRTRGTATHQSAVLNTNRIYKNYESNDWTVGVDTYNPGPSESCRQVKVQKK